MSVDLVNTGNSTAYKAEIRFRVTDQENPSRVGFFNVTSSKVQVPNNTWIGPIVDGSGFTLYMPEWHSSERVRFLVDNISISSDFPANLSSLGSTPIYIKPLNESLSFEYSAVFTVIGRTFYGTGSIASLHQFTYKGITEPPEERIQAAEYSKVFFAFSYFLASLIPLWVWSPKIWRRLPFVTFTLVLLMVFIYAFVGSGNEIEAMPPYPWNSFKTWPLGTFMHAYDIHISGNLANFVPLSILLEVWLNVKVNWRRFATWYILPILLTMLLPGIGFSITNEFLAWALWGLIIVDRKKRTRLDLLLCIFSGVMASTFFGWLFGYLPYVFSAVASTWWGYLAWYHIFWGSIGVAVFAIITLVVLKRQGKHDQERDNTSK